MTSAFVAVATVQAMRNKYLKLRQLHRANPVDVEAQEAGAQTTWTVLFRSANSLMRRL